MKTPRSALHPSKAAILATVIGSAPTTVSEIVAAVGISRGESPQAFGGVESGRSSDLGTGPVRDDPPDDHVVAVRRYADNSELIEAAARLGHLNKSWLVVDVTYGKGVWWRRFRPDRLVPSDLYPDPPLSCDTQDATALPYPDGLADAVAIDPPYKLNGTDDGSGRRYGVHEYLSAEGRHDLMRRMMIEGARVLKPAVRDRDGVRVGGRLLFKCQDQVNGGRMHWQTYMAFGWATEVGLTLVEQLGMANGRPQPDRERRRCLCCHRGKVSPSHRCGPAKAAYGSTPIGPEGPPWLETYPSPQEHAYMRPSTLMIFRKD